MFSIRCSQHSYGLFSGFKKSLSFILLALIVFVLRAEDPKEGAYSFVLNGKPFKPYILSVSGNSTDPNPRPGDMIYVGRYPLPISEPRKYEFIEEGDDSLFLLDASGKRILIGVTVTPDYKRDSEGVKIINPLAKLNGEAIQSLRRINLHCWIPELEQQLKAINPAQTCIIINNGAQVGRPTTLPPLPGNLQYLYVDQTSSGGILDLTGLEKLTSLKFLRLHRMEKEPLDLKALASLRNLNYLDLHGEKIVDASPLAALNKLLVLDLSWSTANNLSFIGSLKSLRVLNVGHSGVADLSPLRGAENLQEINADLTPVNTLPGRSLKSLRKLSVLSTQLKDEDIRTFQEKNPKAQIQNSWVQLLRTRLASSDFLRVRSGGTCHRRPAKERTLAEIKDVKEVQAFLSEIELLEKESGFHCMCCGEPSLEFFKGSELLATIGFHHSQSLRWSEGWPGDAALAPKAAEWICRWLAKNGVPDPLKQWEENRKKAAAMESRWKQYENILGIEVYSALGKAESEEAAIKILESVKTDIPTRTIVLLRLYGCDDFSWNLSCGLDELLTKKLLPKIPMPTLINAVENQSSNQQVMKGAARWLFEDQEWKKADKSSLEKILPKLAEVGLTHPRKTARETTARTLVEMNNKNIIPILQRMLKPKISSVSSEVIEPDGMVAYRGHTDNFEKYSDQAVTALVLAKLGDKGSVESVSKLLSTSSSEDKPAFEEALKLMKVH
jgi:hypothetical protein